MTNGDNATYLFGEMGPARLHCSSEPFWTALLTFFMLHLGAQERTESRISVYRYRNGASQPGYEVRRPSSFIQLAKLQRQNIRMEPKNLVGYRGADTTVGGICPDIFVELPEQEMLNDFPTHLILECKTIGADLRRDQILNYLKFADHLQRGGDRCEVLLVTSVGSEGNVYARAKEVQAKSDGRFGLLLWEDLFRRMAQTRFALPGFDFQEIVSAGYTKALDDEVFRE